MTKLDFVILPSTLKSDIDSLDTRQELHETAKVDKFKISGQI